MNLFLLVILFLSSTFVFSQTNANFSNESLEFYPLQNGNIFQYQHQFSSVITTIKVLNDTLLENGRLYQIIKESYSSSNNIIVRYERVDSITGIVYQYYENDWLTDHEYMLDNLYAKEGDTSKTSRFWEGKYFYDFETICTKVDTISLFGYLFEQKHFYDRFGWQDDLDYYYTLIDGIGLYTWRGTSMFGSSRKTLVYAKVNNKEYGTPITTIDIDHSNIPQNIYLSQNYPNPFNPTTNIRFTIIKNGYVALTVYDIRGREV